MRDQATARHRLNNVVAGLACLALGMLAATGVAARSRECVRAAIPEPFTFPDGSQHPAGMLRICLDRTFSPMSGVHSVMAGERGRALFASNRVKAEAIAESGPPQIVFARDAALGLTLLGYTVPTSGATQVYWFETPRPRRRDAGEPLIAKHRTPGDLYLVSAASH